MQIGIDLKPLQGLKRKQGYGTDTRTFLRSEPTLNPSFLLPKLSIGEILDY